MDDRGATARRQELRRKDKEEEEAEAGMWLVCLAAVACVTFCRRSVKKSEEDGGGAMAGDDEDVEAAMMRKMVRALLSHHLSHHCHQAASFAPGLLFLTATTQGMPTSFDSSHNKKVEGNYSGLVKRDTKRSARQYMNRIGDATPDCPYPQRPLPRRC